MIKDIIPVLDETTLPGLFRERVERTPDAIAYRQFDTSSQSWVDYSWKQTGQDVAEWQKALANEKLERGDRVAVMLHNCREWVLFEQAALGLGLVVVPLYINDRADNVAYIVNHADARLLFIGNDEQWQEISKSVDKFKTVMKIVSLDPVNTEKKDDKRLITCAQWLPEKDPAATLLADDGAPTELATIVYTSGTTGKPKGVMLSHQNILTNAASGSQCADLYTEDLFLSFLPLSHMLERMVGYYLPIMTGSTVAYSRGIPLLGEDLVNLRPTILISVPRIYERVYAKVKDGLAEKSPLARALFKKAVDIGWYRFNFQHRRNSWHPKLLLWPILNKLVAGKILEKLGGRLRIAITGGAALAPRVSQTFTGLGVPLFQGYGLTETSPLISVNRLDNNDPASVGLAIPGIEVRVSDATGHEDELLVRGPNVMLGYWRNQEATDEILDVDGWLSTGDKVEIRDGRIYIVGRIKEIIVLSNGEKITPTDMELAVCIDSCFEQVLIHGEARPYPIALIVLNPETWEKVAAENNLGDLSLDDEKIETFLLKKIAYRLKEFPGYAHVRRAAFTLDPWTVENGLITPTLKTKRKAIVEHHQSVIDRLYEGH